MIGGRQICQTEKLVEILRVKAEALTAYAIRSPLGSLDNCVGRPRSVVGWAARTLSIMIDILTDTFMHQVLIELRLRNIAKVWYLRTIDPSTYLTRLPQGGTARA